MLKQKETFEALDKFGDTVKTKSKLNLKRKNKKASGRLINSIDYDIKVSKNSFQFDLYAEDYWAYVDYGVKGIGGTKADGTKWKRKLVTNNKFKYRSPSKTNSNGGFLLALGGWTIKRSIAPRSKGGQFQKRRGLIYSIRTSIFHTGIETTDFLTKPLEKEFKELPDKLVEAFGLDTEQFLEFIVK